MRQADIFLKSEGNAWLARNLAKLTGQNDPVLEIIRTCELKPASVLEIGCANGWRLDILREKFQCMVTGVDPATPNRPFILKGTADKLPIKNMRFDLVIYGWCLYLCDREDLFKITAEGDRVLKDGGHLMIYDFKPMTAMKRFYKHHPGVSTYKYDYSKLWLANPAYQLQHLWFKGSDQDCVGVWLLHKSIKRGWPLYG